MASSFHPATPDGTPHVPGAMTRCACAEMSFEQVAREMAQGRTFEDVVHRSGCGQTCTACLPDLRAYLAALSAR